MLSSTTWSSDLGPAVLAVAADRRRASFGPATHWRCVRPFDRLASSDLSVLVEIGTGAEARSVAYDSAVNSSLAIRPARVEDVVQMARVNVRCWQETYRGLMTDAVLDSPGFLAARERFWTAALTDKRYRENRVAVAEQGNELIGIAMSGPAPDVGAAWSRQLYVLYVYVAHHGAGAGPALLEAVVDPEESVALWVADANPRAQAFYRKHGFVADGAAQVEGGLRVIRMVRGGKHRR